MDPGPTNIENVIYIDNFDANSQITGTIYLTLTHIFFISKTKKHEFWLENSLIVNVTRLKPGNRDSPSIVIKARNYRVFSFVINKEQEINALYTSLIRHTYPRQIDELPCFVNSRSNLNRVDTCEITLANEFKSMGLPSECWRETSLNKDYKLCDSYPEQLFVPSTASDSTIVGSANFRSKRRFPALTYLHPNMNSALCRCSQPNVGLNGKSIDDQDLFEMINSAKLNGKRLGKLSVVDSRPQINAFTNRALGKGHEDDTNYKNIHFQFFNIENIHVMRKDFKELLEALHNDAISIADYAQSIDKSHWLKHLRLIMEASYYVAYTLESGNSVIVHCSDGWDRTSQVCSLSQIILDPKYRTLTGFMSLIEKDWISFGYKFIDRSGLIASSDPKDVSPAFTQWLECVNHLLRHCPEKFQFNEDLLIMIHDAYYSAEYGNFIGNTEKARKDMRISERTRCLWEKILKKRELYLNPYYNCLVRYKQLPNQSAMRSSTELLPKTLLRPQYFQVWRGLYLRQAWRLTSCSKIRENFLANWISAVNYTREYLNNCLVKIYSQCLKAGVAFEDVVDLERIHSLCLDHFKMIHHQQEEKKNASAINLQSTLTSGIANSSSMNFSKDDSLESDEEEGEDPNFVMELLEDVSINVKADFDSEHWESNIELKKILSLDQIRQMAENSFSQQKMTTLLLAYPERWQTSVSSTATCPSPSCGIMFALSEKRELCHACGQVFCDRCFKNFEKIKYCFQCYDELMMNNQSTNFST